MRKALPTLLSAMAIVAMAPANMSAHAPQPVNPPAELPAGISVSPVQGFVDISNNASPNGVSSIGLSFSQEVVPNAANTEPALLYHNDMDTPAASTLITSIDTETWRLGGVIFKDRTWNVAGVYKVEIPAGMFCYASGVNDLGEPTGTEPTPGMTLYYEIYKGYSLSPASGTYGSLSEAELTFTDAYEVEANPSANTISFYMDNSMDSYMVKYELVAPTTDDEHYAVKFSFGSNGSYGEVSTPGIYGLLIPAGAFTYRSPGPSFATDPTDYVERTNEEILVKYTVPRYPAPEIDPDPNFAIKQFDSFNIYLPDGFTLWFADNMAQNNIYRVDEEGNIDTTKVYAYAKAGAANASDGFVTLNLYDPVSHQPLATYTPDEPGLYCLRLCTSLLFGEWPAAVSGGEPYLGGSDAYDYFYTVISATTGIGCPGVEAETISPLGGVYNLNGVRVAEEADAATMRSLPKGVYISGGRKIMN